MNIADLIKDKSITVSDLVSNTNITSEVADDLRSMVEHFSGELYDSQCHYQSLYEDKDTPEQYRKVYMASVRLTNAVEGIVALTGQRLVASSLKWLEKMSEVEAMLWHLINKGEITKKDHKLIFKVRDGIVKQQKEYFLSSVISCDEDGDVADIAKDMLGLVLAGPLYLPFVKGL